MAENKNKTKVTVGTVRRPADENTILPLVDIYETEDGTSMLVAEVPGARPDEVDVRVDKGVLTVSADVALARAEGDYTDTYTGFAGGTYFRAFALSDEIDRDRIEASVSDGLLTVSLPRAATARTRKIEIKSGD